LEPAIKLSNLAITAFPSGIRAYRLSSSPKTTGSTHVALDRTRNFAFIEAILSSDLTFSSTIKEAKAPATGVARIMAGLPSNFSTRPIFSSAGKTLYISSRLTEEDFAIIPTVTLPDLSMV
jgi:hypothetical protein